MCRNSDVATTLSFVINRRKACNVHPGNIECTTQATLHSRVKVEKEGVLCSNLCNTPSFVCSSTLSAQTVQEACIIFRIELRKFEACIEVGLQRYAQEAYGPREPAQQRVAVGPEESGIA